MEFVIDPRSGDPVHSDGTRVAATRPHPFVLTINVASRGPVCHLCNGSPTYIVHAGMGTIVREPIRSERNVKS